MEQNTITLEAVNAYEVQAVKSNLTFSELRNGTATAIAPISDTGEVKAQVQADSTQDRFWNICRGFLNFDTSSIPDNATITSAKVSLYTISVATGLGSTPFHVTTASPASPTTPSIDDFMTIGNVSLGSVEPDKVAVNTYENQETLDLYTPFDLNNGGLAYLNKKGITSFGVRVGWDLTGVFTGVWEQWSPTRTTFAQKNHPAYDPPRYRPPILTVAYTVPTPGGTPSPVVEPIVKKESRNRELFFKIEKLDSQEKTLEEKSIKLVSGKIDVGTGGNRRKCSFDLIEPLSADWQSKRWKLYYGFRTGRIGDITYHPQGVFLPINPKEVEVASGKLTSLQGVDKEKLFTDYELDEPVTFTSGTTLRNIIKTVAGWVGETKLTLAQDLGTLGADFTFEEGETAGALLNTLVSSFNSEWFYDVNGYLIARKIVDPAIRPIKYVMDDPELPLYISSEIDIDDMNYYNKVTVVGGKIDTPIYRKTVQNNDAIAAAGGRVVKKYFTVDAAVTQTQVDGRAAYYLSNGVQLPATLHLTNIVLPDIDIGDVVEKNGDRYEIKQFDIPLGVQSQSIRAGKVFL